MGRMIGCSPITSNTINWEFAKGQLRKIKIPVNHRLWLITYWTEINSGEGTSCRQRTDRRSVMILIHYRNGITGQ